MFLNILKFTAFANKVPGNNAAAQSCITSADNKRTMMTIEQFCERIGISLSTERRYRKNQKGWPQPIMIGSLLLYPLAVVEAWERAMIDTQTAKVG